MTNEELYHYAPYELYDEGYVAAMLDAIEEQWYKYEVEG